MRRRNKARVAGAIATGALALSAPSALAAELVGASNADPNQPTLSVFDSENPRDTQRLQVVGQTAGDRVLGLDVRPATGTLYAMGTSGDTSQNYVVQLNRDDKPSGFDGRAIFTPIGARYATTGFAFGYDFNPTVDRIRVFSDFEQNLRVNPDTGAAITDGSLAYAAGDPNEGRDPNAVGAAYLPAPFGGTTTLYDIDASQDTLAVQNPANAGTLLTRGELGVRVTTVAGFDIARADDGDSGEVVAYAALQRERRSFSRLYEIDLATGEADRVGRIGDRELIEALAIIGLPVR